MSIPPDRPALAAGPFADLVRAQRVLVACGAGGVGKTTTSASLALAGARAGRRVLVLTIDPSKRLAETLGVSAHAREPVRLGAEVERSLGIAPPGALSAWMLDPKRVCDDVVRDLVKDPVEAERLLSNRIYGHVTRMIAGMQEYTAVEALHGFLATGRYDVVVLDTPPSRNALSFLDAPSRLSRFLEGRIFQLFLPQEGGLVRGAAGKLIGKVLGAVFGDGPFAELRTFFAAFQGIFAAVNKNALALRDKLRARDTSFLLVTSPAREALDDALFFEQKLAELDMALGGFVLNRSHLSEVDLCLLEDVLGERSPTAVEASALEKLRVLAARERARMDQERPLLEGIQARARVRGGQVACIPDLADGADDLAGLVEMAERLAGSGAGAPPPGPARG